MTISKPDVLFVQHKPDRLLEEFKYLPKSLVSGHDIKFADYGGDKNLKFEFDIETYINQLVVSGHQIFSSYENYTSVLKSLNKSGMFIQKRAKGESEEEYDERISAIKEYGILDTRERISADAMTTVGLWAQSHNKPIFLSDIPDYLYRKNIARNEGLLEMRELLTESCMDVIMDPKIEPQIPYFGAVHRCPDILFHYSDRYTAALLKSVINRNPNLGTVAVL